MRESPYYRQVEMGLTLRDKWSSVITCLYQVQAALVLEGVIWAVSLSSPHEWHASQEAPCQCGPMAPRQGRCLYCSRSFYRLPTPTTKSLICVRWHRLMSLHGISPRHIFGRVIICFHTKRKICMLFLTCAAFKPQRVNRLLLVRPVLLNGAPISPKPVFQLI